MGNCLVVQDHKSIKVMKTDGKILEYTSPLKVHQVLSEFSHHAISDKLPVLQHLHPDTDMLGGRMYYLLPLPVAVPKQAVAKKKLKKTVRFADDEQEKQQSSSNISNNNNNVVRIKLVISKQELQAMLEKETVSIEDIKCHVMKESCKLGSTLDGDYCCNKQWFPALESVTEVN